MKIWLVIVFLDAQIASRYIQEGWMPRTYETYAECIERKDFLRDHMASHDDLGKNVSSISCIIAENEVEAAIKAIIAPSSS